MAYKSKYLLLSIPLHLKRSNLRNLAEAAQSFNRRNLVQRNFNMVLCEALSPSDNHGEKFFFFSFFHFIKFRLEIIKILTVQAWRYFCIFFAHQFYYYFFPALLKSRRRWWKKKKKKKGNGIESTSSMFMKNGFKRFTSMNEKLLQCYQHKAYLWSRMLTLPFYFSPFLPFSISQFNYEKWA